MNRLRCCGREDNSETSPGEEMPEMNSFLIEDEKGTTGVHETAANLLPPIFCLACCAGPIIGLPINQ